jgi:hypothetical protein
MNRPLIEAFLAIPGTPSPDAVVADPEFVSRNPTFNVQGT